ncbi:hypothetical protein HanRHA438_Chr04g0151221 [Helianthus annuus]|uniref:Uncharacterized protein n=1 Tax=Helianthus annuus TaxID=4232 RepID=A0A251UUC3_HELAN|nr:uncharacterized protein LOC110935507 [Helianthus annuus]KAF5807941.1 hypothetical protein HanXRQr2_Chr04g0139751 [Helianthus annuus]KAJ0595139.1 hypothetical protein HanHA89_Chr04g0128031 [Helianthus annuus]KAJ0755825.1 hypothetical protein HanLR1_Chr04g0120181 [Helianthus annuus]KAJ0759606.1 hypothetical protein HanOQP8_Chr04g0128581 [Helianthus annuus]KAJ0924682.1 hypothetical protein HanRHA438_Chr04g0151221 [Helianthus annuus]
MYILFGHFPKFACCSNYQQLQPIRHYRASTKLSISPTKFSAAENMSVKPTVALRAMLVGGVAAFAKIAGAAKAAGGAKLGAAAVAVTAAAGATMSGSKQEANKSTK